MVQKIVVLLSRICMYQDQNSDAEHDKNGKNSHCEDYGVILGTELNL